MNTAFSPLSASSPTSTTAPAGAPPLCRVWAKSWETVGLWSWDVATEVCAICKCALSDVCVECQARSCAFTTHTDAQDQAANENERIAPSTSLQRPPESESVTASTTCRVSWGMCSHVFHTHCLERWLPQRPSCPLCNRPWELRQTTTND